MRFDHCCGGGIGEHAKGPKGGCTKYLASLLLYPAEKNDSRHIGNRHDVGIAHQHVEKSSSGNRPSHSVIANDGVPLCPEQPLCKGDLHFVSALGMGLNL